MHPHLSIVPWFRTNVFNRNLIVGFNNYFNKILCIVGFGFVSMAKRGNSCGDLPNKLPCGQSNIFQFFKASGG